MRMVTAVNGTSRKRELLGAAALLGTALGILILVGGWKWGWSGGKGTTAEEMLFDLGNGVKLTLCWCPPGTFLMGSPATEAGRKANEIQHEVTLTRGFWMAKTETTQAQWAALMSDNPSHFKGEILPVDSVTWDEAKAFAAALTERLRREEKVEAGWEFCLPSEAQWEYACRAGATTAYFTGDGEGALRREGWYAGNSGRKTSRLAAWLQSLPVIAGWFKGKSGAGASPWEEKRRTRSGCKTCMGTCGNGVRIGMETMGQAGFPIGWGRRKAASLCSGAAPGPSTRTGAALPSAAGPGPASAPWTLASGSAWRPVRRRSRRNRLGCAEP